MKALFSGKGRIMPMIQLHVSDLSAAILKSRHPDNDCIKVSPGDILFHHLHYKNLNQTSKTELKRERKLLTSVLSFEVNRRLATFLNAKNRALRVGMYLHKLHLNETNKFIETADGFGMTKMGALKLFIRNNNLTEDDFSLESFYKNWQRYQEKKIKNSCQKNTTVRVENKLLGAKGKFPLVWEKILEVVNYYYSCGKENLICQDYTLETPFGNFERKYQKEDAAKFNPAKYVFFFLLAKHSKMIHSNISKIANTPRRTVSYGIQKIKNELPFYDDLAREIAEIEAILKV